jgi:spore coat polysaccharide biosynthesis protein SpsF (cytidylyltransferase family)
VEGLAPVKRVAIIQARMSSTRLPGKVLEPIGQFPMIVFMLRRVARATQLDHLAVATSTAQADDALATEVERHGFSCFRGDLRDVLNRFNGAAKEYSADIIVRLTGDCPLTDPDLIDTAVSTLISSNFDYVSNVDPPTYPNGLDVEAFTRSALSQAHSSADSPLDREHVTPYIRRNKAQFSQANLRSIVDLSSLRWTVDHADDLAFVRALTASLGERDPILADRFDFLRLLETRGSNMPTNTHERNDYYGSGLTVES